MAKGTLGQVVQRAISDAAFRSKLRTDPAGALSGFDLTADERAALRSGDASKLATFGVDQRMSKAFAMGEAAAGVSKLGVGNDLSVGSRITDGGDPLGTNAILEDSAGTLRNASDDGTSGAAQSAIRDGDGPFLAGSVDDSSGAAQSAIRDGDGPFLAGSVDDTSGSAQSAIRDGDGPFLAGSVDDTSGSAQSAIRDGDGPFLAGAVDDTASAGGTSAFLTSDEMGNASAASVAASDDGGATSAFLTADEMGNDTTGAASSAATESDDAADTSMADPATYDQAHPTES